ncbi:MAG: hypothetical protein E6Q97_39005 [Desulfurellales bacterium]|nr:MAG: hypothetical protein E6Q97_39005 [Desulfurellales bacterium]
MKRTVALALIVVIAATSAGCKQTTFNRIGAVIVAAAEGYDRQIENLFREKLIDQTTYDKRKASAAALITDAKDYQTLLAAFPVLTRENSGRVAAATSDLLRKFRSTLSNPDLGNLPPGSKPVQALGYAITVLDNAAIALAAIFPPSQGPTPANATLPPKAVPARSIKIDLPPKPF